MLILHDWLRKSFSLYYQIIKYNIKQTSYENTEKCQLKGY